LLPFVILRFPTSRRADKFKEIETKTGYPAPWFFVVAIILSAGLIMVIGGVKLLVDVVAFAYPAYMSFKALETSTSVDDKQWYVLYTIFVCKRSFTRCEYFVRQA
jgi:receptor expression-enhancing protein 5/6